MGVEGRVQEVVVAIMSEAGSSNRASVVGAGVFTK